MWPARLTGHPQSPRARPPTRSRSRAHTRGPRAKRSRADANGDASGLSNGVRARLRVGPPTGVEIEPSRPVRSTSYGPLAAPNEVEFASDLDQTLTTEVFLKRLGVFRVAPAVGFAKLAARSASPKQLFPRQHWSAQLVAIFAIGLFVALEFLLRCSTRMRSGTPFQIRQQRCDLSRIGDDSIVASRAHRETTNANLYISCSTTIRRSRTRLRRVMTTLRRRSTFRSRGVFVS